MPISVLGMFEVYDTVAIVGHGTIILVMIEAPTGWEQVSFHLFEFKFDGSLLFGLVQSQGFATWGGHHHHQIGLAIWRVLWQRRRDHWSSFGWGRQRIGFAR